MPFDAPVLIRENAVRVPSLDALENMGIVPVPQAKVGAYMERITRKYQRTPYACWQHTKLIGPLRIALSDLPISGNNHDRSGAPEPIIKLAIDVERNVEGAEFILSHFYTDPILTVTYDHGRRNACLGIWDKGKVIQIAGQRNVESSSDGTIRSWIARLFGL